MTDYIKLYRKLYKEFVKKKKKYQYISINKNMRFNKSKYRTRNIWSMLYRFSNIYDVILTQYSPVKIILNMHAY